MRLKTGAGFPVLAPAGVRILSALDAVSANQGMVLVVTSGSESRGRLATDPHALGEAVDLSVTALPSSVVRVLYYALRAKLGTAFTVLYEVPSAGGDLDDIATVNASATAPHMHIQRRKDTVWPPVTT